METPLILDALNAIREEIRIGLAQVDRQIDGISKRIDEVNRHLGQQEERLRITETAIVQFKTVWSAGIVVVTLILSELVRYVFRGHL